jgi:SSS family solute:Na+ symporter
VVIVVGYVASLFFPKQSVNPNLLYSGWKRERDNAETGVRLAGEEL